MIVPQTCPICSKSLIPDAAADSKFFPFCSQRCKNVDFSRWSDGKYAIVEPLDPSKLSDEELDSLGLGEEGQE
jgi:uncharacterized protein